MKLKRVILWGLALLIALTPLSVCAESSLSADTEAVLRYAMGGQELQQWLDESIAPAAGSAVDNYIIYLNRYGWEADFSAYVQTAAARVQPGEMTNPVSRQRCALALIACGALDSVPEALADETIGKLGVMSFIYGLHLINNGAPSALWTAEELLNQLLELQKDDGGWAVMGQYGDIDVTAMCLQALACNRGNNPRIESAISEAVAFMSAKQLESGGFSGMGRENTESSAQVVLALASLGIDAHADERFVKDGVSALDALLSYRNADGGFVHFPGDTISDETASLQALQALQAHIHSGERFFDLSSVEEREYSENSTASWKVWAWIAIGVLTAAGIIFALSRKRGRIKQTVFVLLLAGIAATAVGMINIESASDYYNTSLPTGSEIAGYVNISIRCDTVAGRAQDGSTPEDGIILDRTEIPFREGDSVFAVLTSAVRQNKIQMEHEGGEKGMAYVTGINYLYEYVYGELSGWMYCVNGETPSIGCGSYTVQDGDEIIWQYTTNLGEDLK